MKNDAMKNVKNKKLYDDYSCFQAVPLKFYKLSQRNVRTFTFQVRPTLSCILSISNDLKCILFFQIWSGVILEDIKEKRLRVAEQNI